MIWVHTGITRKSVAKLISSCQQVSFFPKPNPLFPYEQGRAPLYQARIRTGHSALNQHRIKYNNITDASCNACNYSQEDPVHFFLDCPAYQAARNNMLRSVPPLIADMLPNIGHFVNRRAKESWWMGDPRLDFERNCSLFQHVHIHVIARMMKPWSLPGVGHRPQMGYFSLMYESII